MVVMCEGNVGVGGRVFELSWED